MLPPQPSFVPGACRSVWSAAAVLTTGACYTVDPVGHKNAVWIHHAHSVGQE